MSVMVGAVKREDVKAEAAKKAAKATSETAKKTTKKGKE